MKNLKTRLAEICKDFIQSLRQFPIETLLCIVLYTIVMYTIECGSKFGAGVIILLPLWAIAFTTNRLTPKYSWVKYIYYAIGLLWIPIVVWSENIHYDGTQPIAIGISAIMIIMVGVERMLNDRYCRYQCHLMINAVAICIVGLLLCLLIWILYASVSFLFELYLFEEWALYPMFFVIFVLLPLLECFLVNRDIKNFDIHGFLKPIVNYVFTPALLIYTLILHGYLFKIILRMQLPDGGLVWWIMPFIAIGLGCYLMRLLIEKRVFEWYYKYFTAFSIIPLVLLWIGIVRRIGDYGLTETRFYMLLSAICLTAFCIMLLFEKTRQFQLMAFVLTFVIVLFTYIPGIQAKDFGFRSQQARLEKCLPYILEDGKFPDPIDYDALVQDSVKANYYEIGYEAWLYLDLERRKEFEKNYGRFDFSSGELKSAKIVELSETQRQNLDTKVDLGDYYYIPYEWYTYDSDNIGVAFTSSYDIEKGMKFFDSSYGDTLLYCPITERLFNTRKGKPFQMSYENDRFKVIFNTIEYQRGKLLVRNACLLEKK